MTVQRKGLVLSRRGFLQGSGLMLAGLAGLQTEPKKVRQIGRPLFQLDTLEKFVDPLPIPAVAKAGGTRPDPEHAGRRVPYYRLAMRQIQAKLHRNLPATRVWGFGAASPGPTIETRSGEPLLVEWANELPKAHFLPIDYSLHGSEKDKPDVRAVTHLHGAKAPAKSDGYPEDWYVPGKSATYYYPNAQDAAMLWYHDHAMGITRLNMYAGLFGAFFVRDSFEDGLHLPRGKYEIPLMIYDRFIDAQGQLFYPISPDEESPWVSEVFGDARLINGKLYPYLDVEPCKYRFRLLNAANARFFDLTFENEMEMHQIGSDLGLLPSPVAMKRVVIAPAERYDLIVDFAGHAGERIVLKDGVLPVMEFRVGKAVSGESGTLPAALRPVERIAEADAVTSRLLTLGEMDDRGGNAMKMLLNNAHWSDPVTENPKLNSVEIWSFANFTDDTHPIHLHAVRFQILDRRAFEPEDYYTHAKIRYIGPAVPATGAEVGWKDTAKAPPGSVTRIIARFDAFPGRYVWHCHLLEHEDNEMMRPYDIVP